MRALVFDVNETLSDMSPLEAVFTSVGADAGTMNRWFSAVLRDGFALAVAGGYAPFGRVAKADLEVVLSSVPLEVPLDEAAGRVTDAMGSLSVHGDVPGAVDALSAAGFRLSCLSNGPASNGERLLRQAGVWSAFAESLSVDDVGAWKPHPETYRYAARRCGCAPGEIAMVAVHPWDIDGAARCGLRTVWVNRSQGPYPEVFKEPDAVVGGFDELAQVLRRS